MSEVSLRFGEKVFVVRRDLLCEHSDYFSAMFSGSYVESEKQEIKIDMLDPFAMRIILRYIQKGTIFLSAYPISFIRDIAIAANFLQMKELTKQIQYDLDKLVSESNWVDIMAIARDQNYTELEQYSVACGLYSFNSMKPDYIPTIQILLWYLSHPYLDFRNELYVFKFGLQWLYKHHQMDNILLILACLDMRMLSNKTLKDIQVEFHDYIGHIKDNLFMEIVYCLCDLTSQGLEISEVNLNDHKIDICEKFTERVWSESLSIIRNSRPRLLKYVPVVHLRNDLPDLSSQYMYTFDKDSGFKKYLEVAVNNLCGWSVAAWGLTKLVVVGGEYGRNSEMFMQRIKVYDTLKKQWEQLNAPIPPRKDAGVTIVGDLLYVLGGVGESGVPLDTAIVYDLKDESYRYTARLPEAGKSPLVCSHNNTVFVGLYRKIYCYVTHDGTAYWKLVIVTEDLMSFIKSYDEYIYCTRIIFRTIYRWGADNDIDNRADMQSHADLKNLPLSMFHLGDRLLIFSRSMNGTITAEEYKEDLNNRKTIVYNVKTEMENGERFNGIDDRPGSCSFVMDLPPLYKILSGYHQQYLQSLEN